ncbi:RHS repeat domain-containing protein [Plantactinospora mayteni]|uniref:RHS repeat domain-containing protein n=1 Tax=Plantactinospora mayteni TaxID=566021 RepID=UPI00194476D7|nr:RHS repeat-associated core domain-containing protein [Plantactinospora mayteni]
MPGRPLPAPERVPDPESGSAEVLPAVRWPEAGAAEVALVPGRPVRVGTAPIEVSAGRSGDAPARVRVETLDQAATGALGGVGLAFRLARTEGGAGRVRVDIDYSGFRYAYGGNFADRLRLMRVACTTRGCAGAATPVEAAHNDLAAGRVSAEVDSTLTGVYLLGTAASGMGTGDYRATSLLPSGKWVVGPQSGSFTQSYPLTVPPSISGDAPELAFGYDSSSVDGRTSATNNQASWVGLGWGLGLGFIERQYKSCVEDGDPYHADMCWSSPYSNDEDGAAFVMSLDGVTTELIRTGKDSYRMRDDRGWRVEHRYGGTNADNTGEYWVVSTPDGEQHTFGYRADSNWTVPVVGDDAGEPCHGTAPVPCRQSWRWNLDKVVDANENVTAVYWTKETNNYKQANGGATYRYDRGGYLDRVEYGMQEGQQAAAQVDFTPALRCTQRVTDPAATCPPVTASASAYYPDVPVDLICADGASCGKVAPSFFLTSRLDSISAKVWDAGTRAWQEVTRWQPRYAFPPTPDSSSRSLWLNSIQQTGVWGTEPVTLPPVEFDGVFLDNRQDYTTAAQRLQMRRVSVVRNGLGAETKVRYEHGSTAATCPAGGENAGWEAGMTWDQNRYECFRVRFKPEGATSLTKGVFHKYVVTKIEEVDLVGGSPTMTTSYEYGVDDLVQYPAWHRDDELLTAPADMDWTDWRGYQTVRVTEGGGGADRQTVTESRYFRGMNGDLLGSGAKRTETVKDYSGQTAWPDDPQFAGLMVQEQRFRRNTDGTETELASERHTYWDSGIIADGPGPHDVRMVREAYTYARDRRGDGSWRETSELSDGYTVANGGLPTRKTDFGETGVADSVCTEIEYAQNTADGQWLLDLVEREEAHAGDPDGASMRCTGPVIDRTVTLYDNAAGPGNGVNEPTDGNPTEVRSYTEEAAFTVVRNSYDGYGRELTETDSDGVTKTAYSPATGFPTGGITVTDPAGFGTTTVPSPAFDDVDEKTVDANELTTSYAHDGLGRLRKVWLPTEQPDTGTPSYEFSYRITFTGTGQPTKPTVVTAKQLQALAGSSATWLTSHTYHDGLGRAREVQSAAPSGSGRTVAVTTYDDRGLTRGSSAPMWNSTAPGDNAGLLLNPATSAIPSWTEKEYDALEREVTSTLYGLGSVKARTTTENYGNGTIVTPPVGGRTATWQDAFDRTVQIQQNVPAGVSMPRPGLPTTTYSHTPGGELASLTDPAGNVISYTYDWQGRRKTAKDPNAGASTTTYDAAGRIRSTVDARGQKITYSYDPLGRRRVVWSGEEQSGTKLAEWTYDTVAGAKGQLASTTRYLNGAEYKTEVTDYDPRYRVTGRRWKVPANEGGPVATYDFSYGYDRADHLTDTTYPEVGGLPAETVHQTYTATGAPSALTSNLGTYVKASEYNGSGQLANRDYGTTGEVRRTHSYEETGDRRLTGLATTAGADAATRSTVQDDAYTYDAAGNVLRVADSITGQSECYTYDPLVRLTAAWTTTAANCSGGVAGADGLGPDPFKLEYRHDATGNITSVADGSATKAYTYPASGANSVRPQAVTSVGADTYAYNANGAQTLRSVGGATTTSTYDEFGKLASSTTAGSTTSYVNDADGARLIRRAPGGVTVYLDGMELAFTTSVSATRFYRLGGELAAMRTSGGVKWLLTDPQDSVQLAIDAGTGTPAAAPTDVAVVGPVARQRYLPYGAQRGGDDITATDRGYLGKVEDPVTKLVALDNREHDPSIGKLTSPDPLLLPDDPTSQNAYAYGNNNPATLTDPSGLASCRPGDCPTRDAGLARQAYSTKNKKKRNFYLGLARKYERREARIYRRNYQRSDRMTVCWSTRKGCGRLPKRDRKPLIVLPKEELKRVGFTTNCGIFTCSAYISRNNTRWLADHPEWLNGASLGAAYGCSMLPVPHQAIKGGCAFVVGLNWAVMSANINRAKAQNKCFKITWGKQVPSVYYSTNNGLFCAD